MFSKHCFFLDNSLVIWSCSRLNPVIFASLKILMKRWFNFFLITWYWFGPHCFEGRTRAVRSSAVFEYRLPTLKLSFLIMFFFYLSFSTLLFFNLDSFSHLDDSKNGQSHHCATSDQISHHLGSSI